MKSTTASQRRKKGNAEKEIPREEGFMGQKMIILPPNLEHKSRSNVIIKRFYLTAIGFYPHAGYHHKNRPSGCKDFILIYCISGQGNIILEDRTFQLVPNSYFIIPKDKAHHYESSEEFPWSIYWAHFNGEIAGGICNRLNSDQKYPAVQLVAFDEGLLIVFQQICEMLEHSFNVDQLEISSLNLLHFLSRLVYHKQIHHTAYDNDSISQSIVFMKENLHLNLALEDLASQQDLSSSHYVRIFRKKMGMPPVHYFNQLKIQKSCQYLYFTDRNIKNICVDLGFEDQYYFSRLFKRFMGISPANYRKAYKS
ncbi:MAG TPA: AraC family transcriptional regulator [Arachidicoccus sp.]|nr:AraC family transcriptional regulator [Arachidicoccus sp.]